MGVIVHGSPFKSVSIHGKTTANDSDLGLRVLKGRLGTGA